MNRRPVTTFVGAMIAITGVAELCAAAVAQSWGPDEGAQALWISGAISVVFGGFLWLGNRRKKDERPTEFHRREALAAVGIGWMVAVVFGALPYLLNGAIPTLADAIFESASGFTTTGSSILSSERIDALPDGLGLWRALTQWLGGAGIVVVLVSILPMGGRNFFQSEVAGFDSDVRVTLARESARETLWVYLGLTLAGIGALRLAGMTTFDSVLHSFTTVATGGFSNHGDSLGHYDNWKVQGTVIALMFLAGTAFSFYTLCLRSGPKRMFSAMWKSTEWRVYVGVILLFSAIIVWFGRSDHPDLSTSIRHSLFQVASIGTSTGFSSTNWLNWPELSKALLLILIMTGACVGSTSGGIKLARVVILAKKMAAAIRHAASPRRVTVIQMDGASVSDSIVGSVINFALIWSATLLLGAFFLVAFGVTEEPMKMVEAVAAAGTCLGNIGPGLGERFVDGSFEELSAAGKLCMSTLMILGRLEFYALLVALVPRFWKD